MSRQLGSLHRSNSHPANLQNPIPIIPLFAFPHLILQLLTYHLARIQTLIQTLQFFTQFNNSDLETPDEFANSEPSPPTYSETNPSNFSQPPFQLINASQPLPSLSTPSHASQPTQHILHPFLTDQPIIPQISRKFPQS